MLKKILVAFALLLAGFAGFVATQPAGFAVERSATIGASPEIVFGFVNDFRRWAGWSPWEKLDPAMTKSYEGADSGPGAVYSWTGNDKVGEGRMTITASREYERVDIQLEFFKPWQATNATVFTLRPAEHGMTVVWRMEGKNDFMGKAFSLFMNMDAMVGKDFEQGLAALKGLAEAEAATKAGEAAAVDADAEPGSEPDAAPEATE